MLLGKRVVRKATRDLKSFVRKRTVRRLGILFVKPNYIFLDQLDRSSIIIDVGCGDDADLSVYMIARYGLRAYGVDPTAKHAKSLYALEKSMRGRFKYVASAVTAVDGKITFHESLENVSGSLLNNHLNVLCDRTRSYQVLSTTLAGLRELAGHKVVDYLKLDIEGAEYELLNTAADDDLYAFNQIFVEFHHHCTGSYSELDTASIVSQLRRKGFQPFTVDDQNYLFINSGFASW